MKGYRALVGPALVVLLFLVGMVWSPFAPHREPSGTGGLGEEVGSWADSDWAVFSAVVERAIDAQLDTLPMGALRAELGRSLVGTPYVPGTLEVEGAERLVIDFQGLDCVTFVENIFAIAQLLKGDARSRVQTRATLEDEYEVILTELRYRDRTIEGYASRLHYFSDWIGDAQRKRLVLNITRDLGGVLDREPIEFMSTHAEAYRQLADPRKVELVRDAELRLSEEGRHFIPEEAIEAISGKIHDGDIIAATSTVDGLDVAHTGLALWVDGELHLMHAPLAGEAVQISEMTLSERIQRIEGQDGIIVARPRER
jgi:hypothetical protein